MEPIAKRGSITPSNYNDINNIFSYVFSNVNDFVYFCGNSSFASSLLSNNAYKEYLRFKVNDNRIKIKVLIDVNESNLQQCKELTKNCQIKHIDSIKGCFGFTNNIYVTNIIHNDSEDVFVSTNLGIIEQQRLLFENLWKNAITLEKRIHDLEYHLVKQKTTSNKGNLFLIEKSLKKAKEKILIILPTQQELSFVQSLLINCKDELKTINIKLVFSQLTNLIDDMGAINKLINNFPYLDILHLENVSQSVLILVDKEIVLDFELKTKNNIRHLRFLNRSSNPEVIDLVYFLIKYAQQLQLIKTKKSRLEESVEELREKIVFMDKTIYKQRQKEEALEKILQIFSHEIRNHLVSLNIYCDTMIRQKQKKENIANEKDILILLKKNIEKIEVFTENLANINTIFKGEIKLYRNITPIKKIIDKSIHSFTKNYNYSNVKINEEYHFEGQVYCDSKRIVNLLINILKDLVMENNTGNGIEITIKIEKYLIHDKKLVDNDLEYIKISIEFNFKNSKLISIIQNIDHITRDRWNMNNTEIEMALCKSIVNSHGGKLWASKEYNGKNSINIVLPSSLNTMYT